ALVERLDPHGAAARGNGNGRIDDGRVPARVAAGIFVVGGENGATAPVQGIDIGVDGTLIRRLAAGAGYCDSTRRDEAFGSAFQDFHAHAVLPLKAPPGSPHKNGRPAVTCGHSSSFKRKRSDWPLSAGPPPKLCDKNRSHAASIPPIGRKRNRIRHGPLALERQN